MMIKGKGLINPTAEEIIEFLGDRFIELENEDVKYKDFKGCEHLHFIDPNYYDEILEHIIIMESSGRFYSIYVEKGTFTYVDEYNTANEEPVDIIPEIKSGTEPQRVLAEDGTENQEMFEKDFRIKELEARAHLGNLGSLERERKLTDELLSIVKDMVKRGEF